MTARLYTLEDMEVMGDEDRFELVEGRLVPYSMRTMRSGAVLADLCGELWRFNGPEEERFGQLLMGDVGTILGRDPDSLLGVDILFIGRDHPDFDGDQDAYLSAAPDLAIEVDPMMTVPGALSLPEKARLYLAGGARLVWLVLPATRQVEGHRDDGTSQTFGEDDTLAAGDLLPGFELSLKDLFRA